MIFVKEMCTCFSNSAFKFACNVCFVYYLNEHQYQDFIVANMSETFMPKRTTENEIQRDSLFIELHFYIWPVGGAKVKNMKMFIFGFMSCDF